PLPCAAALRRCRRPRALPHRRAVRSVELRLLPRQLTTPSIWNVITKDPDHGWHHDTCAQYDQWAAGRGYAHRLLGGRKRGEAAGEERAHERRRPDRRDDPQARRHEGRRVRVAVLR